MTTGLIPVLLVVGVGSFVAARPLSLSYLQDETQGVTDLKAIMNTLLQSSVNEQTHQVPINSLGWSSASVKTQKFSDLLKKVGSALCGAAYNPSSLAEAMAQLDQMDEVEMEGFKSFLKRFGSNLCDYITDGNGGASEQVSIIGPAAPYFYPRLQKQNVAELQGFSQVAKKIGSALCKAAYDGSDLNVLAEAISSWQKMDEAEIESVKDFFRRFGSNLCDYITKNNGDSGRTNKQDYAAINTYSWPNHKNLMEQGTEIQGFLSTVRKIGSALCRAAYNGGNAVALPQSLGITDEAQVQRFKDFLKRFGSNLCDYVTDGNGKTSSNQEVTSLVQSNAEAQGFFKKVADALCRAGYGDKNPTAAAELLGLSDEAEVQKFTDFLKQFGSNLCDYVTNGNGRESSINEQKLTSVASWPIPNQDQDKSAEVEGLLSAAKKIGSALCRALDGNPSAMVESVTFWGEMDQVEAESFKDLLKTFGSRVCDYITKGDGKVDTKKNELAQELIAIVE